MTPWIYAESLHPFQARQSILAGSGYNKARLVRKRELSANLRRGREIRLSFQTSEMEHAAAVGNSCKPFHPIRATDSKELGMSPTVCEADARLFTISSDILYAEQSASRYNLASPLFQPIPAIPAGVRWPVTTNPPTKAKILREIPALGR